MFIKRFMILPVGVLLIALTACQENDANAPAILDCGQVILGLVDLDGDLLGAEMDQLAKDLDPDPSTADPNGHAENLDILVNRINTQCPELSAEVRCYACIETLPLQSEIVISLDSAGVEVFRIIDMFSNDDGPMTFREVHP